MEESFPVFEYSLSGKEDKLYPEDKLWTMLLSGNTNLPVDTASFTIGEYLLSARRFLEENQYLVLKKGLEAFLTRSVEISEVNKIVISLEKHGPFYHPIKVIVILKNKTLVCFVLNGAVSAIGLAVIEDEYQNLKKLHVDSLNSKAFIPQVFGMGFIESKKGELGFFLAQWFDQFEEFHVVRHDNKNKTGLLKEDGSFSIISDLESFVIYEKIAEILTLYFDLASLKQIFPWHHAAGDFVVKIDKDKIDVKLITVRGYERLMETDTDNLLLDLFFFFLNLSLRMRIDRNKGIEEYIFLDEIVVKASVDGFIKGLQENFKRNQKVKNINPDLLNIFIGFIQDFDLKTLLNAFIMIAGSYNKDAPEVTIIEENLETHAKAVFKIIGKI